MDNTKALLLFSLLQFVTVGKAVPLSREAVRSKVKRNAEQLLRKIEIYRERHFSFGPTINLPPDNVDGLSSIVVILEGYDSLLSNTLDGVPQLKQEVSSLEGYLNEWRQGLCGDLRPKPSLQGRLAELQSRKEYVHTVNIVALIGLKDFLGQLLKNLDLLGTC